MFSDEDQRSFPDHHDFDDPAGADEVERMRQRAWTLPRCPWCRNRITMVPMTGISWGLVHNHEPLCPNHDDNAPDPTNESCRVNPYKSLRDERDNPDRRSDG